MKVISLYAGYTNASTGVASVVKSLDQGSWSEFALEHTVFAFDQKGLAVVEKAKNTFRASKRQTLKKQCLSLLSIFRLWLWRTAEKSVFAALIYFRLFHEYRAKKLVNSLYENNLNDEMLIVHDIWSLLALSRQGNSLTKVLFVIHGSDDPISFMLDIFPSLKPTKFINQLKTEFSACLSNVKAVIVLSEDNLNHIKTKYDVDTQLILNGIPAAVIDNDLRSGLNLHITGSLCTRKRQYLLLNAVAKLGATFLNENNVKVNCFGGGPDHRKLELIIEKYDLIKWVTLHGNTQDPYLQYNFGDVILCISTEEGLPVALIEGLRSGCVPVVTDVGGCHLTIANDNGLLLTEKNDALLLEELVSAIKQLTEQDKRSKLATKSLTLFQSDFSNNKMIRLYANAICA